MNFSGNRRECNACRGRAYYARNSEMIKAKVRVYAVANKEELATKRRAYYEQNPRKRFGHEIKRRYGVTLEEYDALLVQQQGCCAICKTKPRARLSVDHCHTTGRVRGALCSNCNTGLGMFKDNTELLEAAVKYLA